MKLQSEKKIDIRGRVIGGERMLLCISCRPQTWEELVANAAEAKSYNPDMIEWRIDHYDALTNADFEKDGAESAIAPLLKGLDKWVEVLDGVSLMICFRKFDEGGVKPYSLEFRAKILEILAKTGKIDLVDLEIEGDQWFNDKMSKILKDNGVTLIYSRHEWGGMSGPDQIIDSVLDMQAKGADIAKYAAVIKNAEDAITLARVGRKLKEEGLLHVPLCFYPLGEVGLLMRVLADEYGVDYMYCALNGTYEGGVEESTIDYKALREVYAE